jgi:hypothetical protein
MRAYSGAIRKRFLSQIRTPARNKTDTTLQDELKAKMLLRENVLSDFAMQVV